MSAGDVSRAIRYLVVVLAAYVIIAVGTGHDIRFLELAVFGVGVVTLVLVAHRLSE